jgi:hypothetical protein
MYKQNTNLFLSEVTVQLLAFHAQQTENNAHLVGEPFASQENYDIVPESSLAKRYEECRAIRFLPRPDTYELLNKTPSGASSWVHEKSYWPIERHLNELINRVCHCSGEQHGLP